MKPEYTIFGPSVPIRRRRAVKKSILKRVVARAKIVGRPKTAFGWTAKRIEFGALKTDELRLAALNWVQDPARSGHAFLVSQNGRRQGEAMIAYHAKLGTDARLIDIYFAPTTGPTIRIMRATSNLDSPSNSKQLLLSAIAEVLQK